MLLHITRAAQTLPKSRRSQVPWTWRLTALGCSLRIPSYHKVGGTLENFKLQELHLVKVRKALAMHVGRHRTGSAF